MRGAQVVEVVLVISPQPDDFFLIGGILRNVLLYYTFYLSFSDEDYLYAGDVSRKCFFYNLDSVSSLCFVECYIFQ